MKLKCIAIGLLTTALVGVVGYFAYPLIAVEGARPECIFAGGIIIGFLIAGILGSRCRHSCKAASSGEIASIYVGNAPYKATQDELRQLFSKYGTVEAVRIVRDRQTGRPRGFNFVEMPEADARKAVKALDGSEFGGRTLKVNLAEDKPER